MKLVIKPVGIGSDQLRDDFLATFGVPADRKRPGKDGKPGFFKIPLGNVSVQTPETIDDLQALIVEDSKRVIEALARQLVTDARNAKRKAHQKAGDGALLTQQRMDAKAWLFTPEGQPFVGEYMLALASKDAKVENACLDKLYKEQILEDESAD